MLGIGREQSPFTRNRVMFSLVIVAVVFFAVGYLSNSAGCPSVTGAISAQDAGNKAVSFINSNMLQDGISASVENVTENSGVYVVALSVSDGEQGAVYESYVTKDGNILFTSGIDLNQEIEQPQPKADSQTQLEEEVPKTAKPVVEMFVMSHCPYGTQVEKGILPVAELLGDSIDLQVKFVYYAMHGKTELDEQLLQHCMQEEFPDKYLDYLECFLGEGNSSACLTEVGADTATLDTCIQETDEQYNVTGMYQDQSTWASGRFPMFYVDKADNEKYGVRGSPHLVINGVTVQSGRDSASLLDAVCNAFTQAPEECSTELSSETPSPGFGYSGTGSGSTGTCG